MSIKDEDEVYLVEYLNWDTEVVKIPMSNYKDRALIQWDSTLNDELKTIAGVYERWIRPINNVNETKWDEYVLIKKVHHFDDGVKWEQYITYTAVNPNGIIEARINLFDIIGRLVSSSPFYSNCWIDRFDNSDLHTSLFLEADDIMCSTLYTIKRKVNKIYYLTHFVNSSSQIRNMFKIDLQYGRDVESTCDVIQCRDCLTFKDYNHFWIINEVETKILEMKTEWYKDYQIASTFWYNKKEIKDIINWLKLKLKKDIYINY